MLSRVRRSVSAPVAWSLAAVFGLVLAVVVLYFLADNFQQLREADFNFGCVGLVWQSALSAMIAVVLTYFLSKLEWVKGERLGLGSSEAFSEPFRERLAEDNPKMGEQIAHVLCGVSTRIFKHHWEQISVKEASDLYRLEGVHPEPYIAPDLRGSDDMMQGHEEVKRVWKLRALSRWTWVNDSREVKFPLSNFVVVVMAPGSAIRNFTPSGKTREQAIEDYYDFLGEHPNRFEIVVANPIDSNKPLLKPDDFLNKYLDLGAIEYRYSGSTERVELNEDLLQDIRRPGIYRVYEMPLKNRTLKLPRGKKLTMTFRGVVVTELKEEGGCELGTIVYPPSDVISGPFHLALTYGSGVEIDVSESFSAFAQEVADTYADPYSSWGRIDQEFEPDENERMAVLEVGSGLTPLHLVSMSWKKKSEA